MSDWKSLASPVLSQEPGRDNLEKASFGGGGGVSAPLTNPMFTRTLPHAAMKLLLFPLVCLSVATIAGSALAQTPKTQRERLGYALGAEIGATFKEKGVDFDLAAFNAGLRDAMTGNRPQMTVSQQQEAIMSLNKSVSSGGAPAATGPSAVDKAAADKNKRDGEAFLAANRTKVGVTTTSSGLQYKVLRDGTGPLPKASDRVVVKYRGTLINGTEFDNSEKHNDGTLTVDVTGGVIAGWTEALKMMHVGAKWQLFIPSSLAYGDAPVGADIGPGSTLIFEVELLSIKK